MVEWWTDTASLQFKINQRDYVHVCVRRPERPCTNLIIKNNDATMLMLMLLNKLRIFNEFHRRTGHLGAGGGAQLKY